MSIASEIQRLSGVRSDIFDSITNKGVTVPESATFSSCPDLIDSIQTGGGGGSNALYNTGAVGIAKASGFCTGSASQIGIPSYGPGTLSGSATKSSYSYTRGVLASAFPVSSISGISATGTYELGVIPASNVSNTTLSAVVTRQASTAATTANWLVIGSESFGVIPPRTLHWSAAQNVLTGRTGDYVLVGWFATGSVSQRNAVPALTGGQLSGTVTGITATGYNYPYPDRPLTETAQISSIGSAAEYVTFDGNYVKTNASGIEFSGFSGTGSIENFIGDSETMIGKTMAYNAALYGLRGWPDPLFSTADYPRANYTFTSGNAQYTYELENYI